MFSERLKILRYEKGLTQEEIANEINTSRQTYANWEVGRAEPSIDMLLNLANYFEVSIDYICCNTDVKDKIYEDPELCKYINKCISIYDEFFKDKKKDQE